MAKLDETTTVSRLECSFNDSRGKALSMSFNYAKPDVADATVKSLMDGIIENGTVFNTVPYEKVGAKLITTATKALDVADE